MKIKAGIVMVLVLAGAGWLQAQSQEVAAYTWITFHRIHLRNGNYLEGALVGRTDRSVTIRQPWGEIIVRNDQIDRVEFVKIKSFKDPEMLVQKRKPASPKPNEISATSDKPTVAPEAGDKAPSDSGEPVPSSIPASVVQSVDQAIGLWKTAAGAERPDLAQVLTSLGADIAPYLEFLLEKRTQSTPLMPVTLAYAAVSEDRFIDFSEKMMTASSMEIRDAAITGLSKVTSPRRIPIVLKAMEDTFPSVWKLATEILLEIARTDGAKSDLVDQIAARIPTSKNTTAFAIALSRIGGRDAHRVLWDLVNDSNETNRMTGLHGIALMADPEDGPKMIALLRDQSAMVRKSALIALGKMKYRPATGDLISILRNDEPGLSTNARWSLREITGQLVPDKNDAWLEWWDNAGSKSDLFK